jgi:hypothetical protein
MSDLDLLFVAKNRLEFTREAIIALLEHTNWSKVTKLWLYDDGSTDGTLELLRGVVSGFRPGGEGRARFLAGCMIRTELRTTKLGSPILVTNDFLHRSKAPLICKIDNDTIVPPCWLDVALGVMAKQPEIDCLGLEYRALSGRLPFHATAADHIGGLYVAHRRAFEHGDLPIPERKYFGWQAYQKRHNLAVFWIEPSIPVFLLDRIPEEPYASLSKKYEAEGWQRPAPCPIYESHENVLWKWWTERAA